MPPGRQWQLPDETVPASRKLARLKDARQASSDVHAAPKCFRGSCFFLGRTGSKGTDHGRADLHAFEICELFKHGFKSGIRLTNTFGFLNNGFAISEQARYGKRHRN